MDIILNPTNQCNFNCKFCAATNLPKATLNSAQTIELINKLIDNDPDQLNMLVINGGDPLLMEPNYYWDLLEYVKNKNVLSPVKSSISITTNLYQFYKDPYSWYQLFKNPEVGVITSFQYGKKRGFLQDGKFVPYNDTLFKEILAKFKEFVGYTPAFIYVVDFDNHGEMKKACELARELHTKVKLNKIEVSGRNLNTYYPVYLLYQKYIELLDEGMGDVVLNFSGLYHYFKYGIECCNFAYECYKYISVINPDGNIYTCNYTANLPEELNKEYRLTDIPENRTHFFQKYLYIKSDCLQCPNFKFCNSCTNVIREVHQMKDQDNYCNRMKSVLPVLKRKIIQTGDESSW